MKAKRCTYCGKTATSKDHVPPKCFFSEPYPPNLITVPSCESCNKRFDEEIDVLARNRLASILQNESHPAVRDQLSEKRSRSYRRKKRNLKHAIDGITSKEVFSSGGVFLGWAPAIKLDDPVMDKFFERLGRGLIRKVCGVGYVDCVVEWDMASTVYDMAGGPQGIASEIGDPVAVRNMGDQTFAYVGWFTKGFADSFWIVQFYGGVEFALFVKAGDVFPNILQLPSIHQSLRNPRILRP
jgi:hypothetical protein